MAATTIAIAPALHRLPRRPAVDHRQPHPHQPSRADHQLVLPDPHARTPPWLHRPARGLLSEPDQALHRPHGPRLQLGPDRPQPRQLDRHARRGTHPGRPRRSGLHHPHLDDPVAAGSSLAPARSDRNVVGVPMLEIHNALGVSWEVVDPDYYRKIVLKIYWDDQETPSVIAPARRLLRPDELAVRLATIRCRSPSRPRRRNCTRSAAAPRSTATSEMPFDSRARIDGREPERHPLPAVLLHRLRALHRAAAGRHRLLPRPLAARRTPTPAGARTCRPTASRRPSRTSTAPTTTSFWRPRARATTSAATSPSATSRAPGGARATT